MARRTAKEEREDVLSFLRAEEAKFERGSYEATRGEFLADRLSAQASCLRTMIAYIARGDHEGAVERG